MSLLIASSLSFNMSYTLYNYVAIMETRIKKWGNSMGIVIPKDVAQREHLKAGQKVLFFLAKPLPAGKLFGIAKGVFKKNTQEIKDELRRALYD